MSFAPPGCTYAFTKSGWMEDIVFEKWFEVFFVKYTKNCTEPIALIYDGHGSHLTYKTIVTAMAQNIKIICLPPNCSHALQPLDVGVFKGLKVQWKNILKRWYRETRLQTVDKAVFPGLLGQLWPNLSGKDAVAGFRNSGIIPLDVNKMKRRVLFRDEDNNDICEENEDANYLTPKSALRHAIKTTLQPSISNETKKLLDNKKRKWRGCKPK